MSGIFFVWVFTAIAHRTLSVHPFAQSSCLGMGMLVFQTGFGMNGLGSMPNPAQFLCTAVFLRNLGYHAWSKHDHYALVVPLWAPLIGVFIGGLLFRVYMSLLYLGRIDLPAVSQVNDRRR